MPCGITDIASHTCPLEYLVEAQSCSKTQTQINLTSRDTKTLLFPRFVALTFKMKFSLPTILIAGIVSLAIAAPTNKDKDTVVGIILYWGSTRGF